MAHTNLAHLGGGKIVLSDPNDLRLTICRPFRGGKGSFVSRDNTGHLQFPKECHLAPQEQSNWMLWGVSPGGCTPGSRPMQSIHGFSVWLSA